MYCQKCGTRNEEDALRCVNCQEAIQPAPPVAIPVRDPNAELKYLLPIGRSLWAIAAGYLGLFSVLFVPAPLALFCGIMAVRDIKRNPKKLGMGRAIFGIVMGGLFTLALAGIIVAAALASHSGGIG